jgi:hypothetical protein
MSKKLSLALREEHRLGVFQNRVLRIEVGPKRDEVTGSSVSQLLLFAKHKKNDHIKENELGRASGMHRGEGNAYRVFK